MPELFLAKASRQRMKLRNVRQPAKDSTSSVLSGDPIVEVPGIKERAGKDIVLTGSITITHALIAAGLVDEFRLFVYPVVQGRGRRLFPDG